MLSCFAAVVFLIFVRARTCFNRVDSLFFFRLHSFSFSRPERQHVRTTALEETIQGLTAEVDLL